MDDTYTLSLPSGRHTRDLIIPTEDSKKSYGDCKIFRINKSTGEEYLHKTIKAEDMGEFDPYAKGHYKSLRAVKTYWCKDCGVEGKRRLLTKVRCASCHKKHKAIYQKKYAKVYNEKQRQLKKTPL